MEIFNFKNHKNCDVSYINYWSFFKNFIAAPYQNLPRTDKISKDDKDDDLPGEVIRKEGNQDCDALIVKKAFELDEDKLIFQNAKTKDEVEEIKSNSNIGMDLIFVMKIIFFLRFVSVYSVVRGIDALIWHHAVSSQKQIIKWDLQKKFWECLNYSIVWPPLTFKKTKRKWNWVLTSSS